MKKGLIKILSVVAVAIIGVTALCACQPSFSAEKNITVVTRESGSGTKSAFMEIIGLKGKTDVSGVIIQTSTEAVLEEVKGNPQAIAYDSLGYVTDDVKTLKVDGVEATVENIKNGSYKISRPLSIVYKAETIQSGAAKAFAEFIKSKAAQDIITAEGYVTQIENPTVYAADASLSGTINISGSTSLHPLMTKIASEFEKIQPNVSLTVKGGGSGTGYKDAENGTSHFGMISEEFTQSKAISCTHLLVAKDGIAVIVNKANPCDSLTIAQIKAIYDKDDTTIKNWASLGVQEETKGS